MDGHSVPKRPVHPVRVIPLAVLGARTNLGGTIVTATGSLLIDGRPVATVGDIVRHPSLGDAKITSGLDGLRSHGRAVAVAGSLTGREDEYIIDPQQDRVVVLEMSDGSMQCCSITPDDNALGTRQ